MISEIFDEKSAHFSRADSEVPLQTLLLFQLEKLKQCEKFGMFVVNGFGN